MSVVIGGNMKKLTVLVALMLLISNTGKPDHSLRIKFISNQKPVELDYRHSIGSDALYGVPQVWFAKRFFNVKDRKL